MAAAGIHHVALTVTRWERARAFYSELAEALGAKPVIDTKGAPHRDAEGRVLIFAGSGYMFSIWEASPAYRSNVFRMYNVGLHHVAFLAPSREEVDRLHQALIVMNADVLEAPREYDYVPGYYAVFFKDPDGMKLEYAHVPA